VLILGGIQMKVKLNPNNWEEALDELADDFCDSMFLLQSIVDRWEYGASMRDMDEMMIEVKYFLEEFNKKESNGK
jgi:hypothetical protein